MLAYAEHNICFMLASTSAYRLQPNGTGCCICFTGRAVYHGVGRVIERSFRANRTKQNQTNFSSVWQNTTERTKLKCQLKEEPNHMESYFGSIGLTKIPQYSH